MIIIIISILPSAFWLWIYLREDARDPEPRRLLLKLFIGGILSGIAGLFFIFIFFNKFGDAALESKFLFVFVLVAPFFEELLKLIVTMAISFRAKSFNQTIDGVIYAVSVALGFAAVENLVYFSGFLSQGFPFLIGGMIIRTFTSTLLHALSTGWLGYWIGRASFEKTKRIKFLLLGFIFAVLIHTVFNFLLLANSYFFALFVLVIVFDLLFVRLRARKSQTIRRIKV